MSVRRHEITNRYVHENASAIVSYGIQSKNWVASNVFDVTVKVRFETKLRNDHRVRKVVDMPGAVVLAFLAKEGKKTPKVYIQPIAGDQFLFDKEGNLSGRNLAYALIDENLGGMIALAAGSFRTALQAKHPGLTIPLILSEDEKRQFGVTVERRSS